ncbi:MAG: hypothetical protein MSC45_07835 [Mobiluncus sp.]|uniref:hypothetical protein n=1 Tax=Mobiluncus sp. TaxID=47293 RepID=UPI002585AA3B|nr:hypothetical protein [Mobiluncus sp.]MCI6584959.1 hypothetical protein [Mobiluncus sp.]
MKQIPQSRYAGDTGELLPQTARALELADAGDAGGAQVALCRALATERLVVPAPVPLPSPAQFSTYSRFVGELPGDSTEEILSALAQEYGSGQNCASQSFPVLFSPFGAAVGVYSSAASLQEYGSEFDRPVLMNPPRVALAVLTQGGVLWLDPQTNFGNSTLAKAAFLANPLGCCKGILLGRAALTALASGDEWLAPWDDPEIPGLLERAAAHTGCEIEAVEAYPAGGLNLKLRVPPGSTAARTALSRFNKALSRDDKLVARVAYFSLTPLKSRKERRGAGDSYFQGK